MSRLLTVLGLQLYALVLAWVQARGGIRTDEAKYLLDIPYPHPPALRWVLSQTEWLATQDMLWRIVFASLAVQATWLVWDLARDLPPRRRLALAAAWLLSGGVLLQAGSVMMVVATALQLLAFLWLRSRPEVTARNQGAVALFWLFSLFTAYQALLFLPLAVSAFRRAEVSRGRIAFYLGMPVLLLALYTLTNPLVPASMLTHAGRQLDETLLARISSSLRVWAIAGSGLVSVAGTWGLLRSRDLPLVASFLLVAGYVVLSRYDYYAILFLPLLVAGLRSLPEMPSPLLTLPALLLAGIATVILVPPSLSPGPATLTASLLSGRTVGGTVAVYGSFGHEWQHAYGGEIARAPAALGRASAVVCLEACPAVSSSGAFLRAEAPVEAYVRR